MAASSVISNCTLALTKIGNHEISRRINGNIEKVSIKTILLTPLALEAKCSANGPKKQRQNLFFHSINLKEGVPSRYVHLSAEEAEQFSIRLVLTNGTVEVLKSKQKLGGKGCLITIDENAESYEVEKFNHVKEFINATMSDPDVAEGKDE